MPLLLNVQLLTVAVPRLSRTLPRTGWMEAEAGPSLYLHVQPSMLAVPELYRQPPYFPILLRKVLLFTVRLCVLYMAPPARLPLLPSV